jgi:FMN phosphatase YigB (HAD superfamily)
MKQLLVLDAGGVLVNEKMDDLYQHLSELSPRPRTPAAIDRYMHQRWRNELWSGEIEPKQFLDDLCRQLEINTNYSELKEIVENHQALPEIQHLHQWAKETDLALLSNHLEEWLLPVLDEAKVTDLFRYLWISSQTARVKPDKAAFQLIKDADAERVLLVDDQYRNLRAAAELGIHGLYPREGWPDLIEAWIKGDYQGSLIFPNRRY